MGRIWNRGRIRWIWAAHIGPTGSWQIWAMLRSGAGPRQAGRSTCGGSVRCLGPEAGDRAGWTWRRGSSLLVRQRNSDNSGPDREETCRRRFRARGKVHAGAADPASPKVREAMLLLRRGPAWDGADGSSSPEPKRAWRRASAVPGRHGGRRGACW